MLCGRWCYLKHRLQLARKFSIRSPSYVTCCGWRTKSGRCACGAPHQAGEGGAGPASLAHARGGHQAADQVPRAEEPNPALVDLVELALYTGMRQGELLELTWGRVDRARGVVLLEITKSGRRREVPLNTPADAILARRAPAAQADVLVFGSRSWNTFRKSWEAALEAGQLGDFHFHDLRHTFASWAVQRGVTLA